MKYGHKGNAKVTTLAVGIASNDLTVTLTDGTGWPDGSTGPFWGSINRGSLSEEKILFSSRTGDVLDVWQDGGDTGRGMDDTVAQSHAINSTIEHVWTATEAELASDHLNSTSGVHGVTGDVVGTTDTQTLSNKTLNNTTFTGTIDGIGETISPLFLMGG